MTKTLTKNRWFYTQNGIKDASWNIVFKDEVLAPVPSYEEWQNMREENTIHNHKAAKRRTHINNLIEEVKALKEELKTKNVKLNELRQQRNEANEVLKDTAHWATDETENRRKAMKYLEKWGVK